MHDRLVLTSDQNRRVGDTLQAAARDCLAGAQAAITGKQKSDAEAVHDFRRGMKRWRALLRLIERFVGPQARSLRDQARDLAGALAGARDAQSALDALADLERHELALSSTSLARLRGRIDELRRAAETTLDSDMRLRIGNSLKVAQDMIAHWPLSAVAFDALAGELARHYRNARRLIPADWQTADPDPLHELRKRVVIHRYQMEMLEPLWPRFMKMWTGEAQRLRERLGKHQDLLVFANLTAPHQPLARWRSRLAPAIAERRAAHVAAAERIAARLFLDRPKAVRRRLVELARLAGDW